MTRGSRQQGAPKRPKERGEVGRSRKQSEREENIQQNHANAPPTWVQHTLEIEDDQDKGSQASGQHHPANSVHPHHFQQRRLHGFVLAAGTRLSGRRVRSAEAGTPPRGTSAREAQNGAGRAPELDPSSFTEVLRAPSPGLGGARRGSWCASVEMRGPGRALLPVRLASARCSAASSAGACGRRCLLAGRATGMPEGRCHRRRALASVTVQAPLPPSLAKSYFIALQ